MNPPLQVVIVLGRCSRTRHPFGIRFEDKGAGNWVADWAFSVKEKSAHREGYDRGEIHGSFGFDPAFPGCPSCRAHSFYRCGCGKVACWDGETRMVHCPWCGMTGTLSGTIDRLAGESDR
jgi:hypothetical protein